MAKKFNLKSILVSSFIGFLAGGFFGWMVLARFLSLITGGEVLLIHQILGALILGGFFLILGLRLPRFTEIIVAGICLLMILQASWDFGAKDWNTWRTIMVTGSSIILLLDIVVGAITWKELGKMGKRQLGVR